MTEFYLPLRLLHIVSSTILFGTGIGTAFAMWRAHASGDARVVAVVCRNVVLADWFFTTPAVIVQPLTGWALATLVGHSFTAPWLLTSLALYVLVGACWLPVVVLQLRMRDEAARCAATGQPLSDTYARAFRTWFLLGWPAFAGVLAIFTLMVLKPVLWT